jgi:hypothetical protein
MKNIRIEQVRNKDSQNMSFQCEFLKTKTDIRCDMSDVYSDNITLETARKITEMLRIREEKLKEKENEN